MALSEELLADVKNYLDIMFEDKAGDVKLSGMIERGKLALSNRIGNVTDWEIDTPAKSLLLNYVMYERSGALDEFWNNYKDDILFMQTGMEAKRYAEMVQQKDGNV